MNSWYGVVSDRAAHRREYCHAPESAFNLRFEVDHVVPSAAGGPDQPDNLALACRSCNGYKSSRLAALDPTDRHLHLLFNPRNDSWEAHFNVDMESFEINGLTPEARSTIFALRLNSPAQLVARRQWVRLDLFP